MTPRRLLRVAAAALLLLSGCAAAPREPAPLLVASDLDNRPFAWLDASGRAQGRDVEMMQALAGRLGRPLVWVQMPFDELLAAAQRGGVDAVCATLGITAERERLVDFSRPYFRTELACVTLARPGAPQGVADLAGRRVGAGLGTTSERALALRAPAARAVLENKAGLPALQRLRSGDVDALVMDGPAADALVASAPGELRRLPEDLGAELYALALPQGSALLADLNRALLELEQDGTLARLDAAHGLRPSAGSSGSAGR